MASFVAQPVADRLETSPAPERLNLADGALLTAAHFQTEQLYHRGQVSRLALHLHGAGTVAGLDVRYAPTTGAEVEIRVAPGMALDRLGRIVEMHHESCLTVALWLAQQEDDPLTRARVLAGLRAAGDGLPDHLIADVYLGFHACARAPEPAFATPNADTIDGVVASRVLDTGQLRLVVRPVGDDREPQSRVSAAIPGEPSLDLVKDYKRQLGWDRTRPRSDPFRLPAGGDLSEHIVTGDVQDGSEILLARLLIPVVDGGGFPVFDASIDLAQEDFVPNQAIRPYSYSADELALLLDTIRR
jgi:hypothetical protein